MKFPNAAKGVSKIFTAEILSLIALIATGGMAVFSAFLMALNQPKGELSTGAVVSAAGVVGFGIIAGILLIIALVFKIVGVVQTAKDEDSFKVIIYLTVLAIIVALVAACFSGNKFAADVARVVGDIVTLICSILIVLGIVNMATKYNNIAVIEKGGRILKLIILIGIISIIVKFIAIFLPSESAAFLIAVFAVIALILSIVQYCVYLSFLSNAKKMLNEEL